jgi:hypothetical protein
MALRVAEKVPTNPAQMTFALRIPEKICELQSQLLSHVQCILSWRAKKGQDAPASSSLGVSPGVPPGPLPAGSIATRARFAKVKYNYENEQQT